VCQLPGLAPRAFSERAGAVREVALSGDGLWIDTARGVCTVTWHGRVEISGARDKGRVLIALERPGEQLSWADVVKLAPFDEGSQTVDADILDTAPRPAIGYADSEFTQVGILKPKAEALPFVGGAGTPPPAASRKERSGSTTAFAALPADKTPDWLKEQSKQAGPPPPPPPRQSSPAAPPAPAPAPPAPSPPVGAPPIPAGRGSSPAAVKPQQESPQLGTTMQGGLSPWAQRSGNSSGGAPPARTSSPGAANESAAVRPPNPVVEQRKRESVPAPAEARPAHEIVRRDPTAHEIVELLWFDPEVMPKVREQREWKRLLEELNRGPDSDAPLDFDEEPEPETPPELVDKRDIVGIMTRGRVTGGPSLRQAMLDAVDERGLFEPPMVLMSGNLQFPFDELETLKATVTACTPFASANKPLEEAIATVDELLQTPWLQNSGDVAQGMIDKLRDTFKAGNHMVSANYLDEHTERVLLEQRHYQKRTVFGAEWIRAQLTPAASRTRVPVYIPEALGKELPMFKSFHARILAEGHVQQDQYESADCSLKVVAFGRVISFTKASAVH
jgi:hypothetical protein